MDRQTGHGQEQPQRRRSSADIPRQDTAKQQGPILNPALFIPITTFPPSAPGNVFPQAQQNLAREEELHRLISNLTFQHETVKQNMLVVARERVKELRRTAQAELDSLGDINDPPGASRDEVLKREIEETMRKMRVPMAKGATAEHFEVKPGQLLQSKAERNGPSRPHERTPAFIRAEIALKIQHLINTTTDEMNAYEKHVKEKIAYYRSLLEVEQQRSRNLGYGNVTDTSTFTASTGRSNSKRRSVSFNTIASPPIASPGERTINGPSKGVLRNAHVQSPVDQDMLRRMDVDDGNDGGDVDAVAERRRREKDMMRREEARALEDMEMRAFEERARRQGKM